MTKKGEIEKDPEHAPQTAHAAKLHAAGIDPDRLRRLPVQEILALIGAIAGLFGAGTGGPEAGP